MLQRNSTTSDGNVWGFGQIMAILTPVGPLIDLAGYFMMKKQGIYSEEDESTGI